MSGISIWLTPSQSSREEFALSTVIKDLSLDNRTPRFRPHLTLLSDELIPAGYSESEIVQVIQRAVQEWQYETSGRLEVEFLDTRIGGSYFQSVYVAADPRPNRSEGLVELHDKLREAFRIPRLREPRFNPHLSLVYGDMSIERKEDIVGNLERAGVIEGNRISGVKGFKPAEITIMRTYGRPENWEKVASVPLGRRYGSML